MGLLGKIGTLQDTFLPVLSFGSISGLKDTWVRRNLL